MHKNFFGLLLTLTLLAALSGSAALAQDVNRTPPAPPARDGVSQRQFPAEQRENIVERRNALRAQDSSDQGEDVVGGAEDQDSSTTAPRGQIQDRRALLRERTQNLRTRLVDSKENFKQARDSFLELKRPTNDTQRAEALEKAKKFALELTDKLATHLTTLQERVQDSDMADSQKQALVSELGDAITKLLEVKVNIEAATTIAEVKKITVQLRQHAHRAQFLMRRHVGLLKSHQFKAATVHIIQALAKIERALEALSQQGLDTSALGADLANIKAKLATLRTTTDNTENAFSRLTDDAGFEAAADSASTVANRVSSDLKQVIAALKELVTKVRQLAGQATDEDN